MNSKRDSVTPIGDLKAAAEEFYTARNWRRFHSPKNLAMSIAIEAAELMEVFQWMDADTAAALAESGPHRDRMTAELADVLIYCLTLAAEMEVDLSTAVLDKIAANARKYPVDEALQRPDLPVEIHRGES